MVRTRAHSSAGAGALSRRPSWSTSRRSLGTRTTPTWRPGRSWVRKRGWARLGSRFGSQTGAPSGGGTTGWRSSGLTSWKRTLPPALNQVCLSHWCRMPVLFVAFLFALGNSQKYWSKICYLAESGQERASSPPQCDTKIELVKWFKDLHNLCIWTMGSACLCTAFVHKCAETNHHKTFR